MYFRLLISLAMVAGTFGFQDKIPGIVDGLWDKFLANGTASINASNWVSFLKRYELIPTIVYEVELAEPEFVDGWMADFNVTAEEAAAYFGYLNIDTNTAGLLNDRDTVRLVAYADDSWNQRNDRAEFYKHIPGLFRPIPWGVMFANYDTLNMGRLNYNQFLDMLGDWDVDGDGEVSLADFQNFWKNGGYGKETTGAKSHDGLDFDRDGVITIDDIDTLFYDYLDLDRNNAVTFYEFQQIDFIINGWASR